jgi:hypothetical protein
MDKLEIKRALLYNKPSILNKTVGLVENIVFPDRIDFYRISPSPSNRIGTELWLLLFNLHLTWVSKWVSEQSSNLATSLMVLASKIGRGLLKYHKWKDRRACVSKVTRDSQTCRFDGDGEIPSGLWLNSKTAHSLTYSLMSNANWRAVIKALFQYIYILFGNFSHFLFFDNTSIILTHRWIDWLVSNANFISISFTLWH